MMDINHLISSRETNISVHNSIQSGGTGTFPKAQVTRPVILDALEFNCIGNEQRLIDCADADVDFYQCGEGFFAHVECLEGKNKTSLFA